MVVSSGVFDAYRVRHVGTEIDSVMNAVYHIVDQFPLIEDQVRKMQSVQLSDHDRNNFAAKALELRWNSGTAPVSYDRLLFSRRFADQGTDLWTTYNVIQENMLQGQSNRYHSHDKAIRAIKSIDSDLSINRGLWSLAEQYATA